MRIAFDAKRAYHNSRGLGNYSRDTIRLLTHYAPENEYFYFGQPTDLFHPDCGTVVAPQGLWNAFPALWRSRGCLSEITDRHIDIYHGLSGELPFGIHHTGTKTLVTMHDTIFVRYPELYSPTYRRLFSRKVQYACDHATRIIAISEQTKQDLVQFFHANEAKIRVVYQGCNNCFRMPVSEEKVKAAKTKYGVPDRYIIDVGAIEPRKNLRNLLYAMAGAHIDLPLVAVGGKSKYAEQMRALATRLGMRLTMLHEVEFTDFPALYKGAECLVYPSIYEGFGIPILEAMCVGTPVLTSTGSCFEETGGKAALYADPNDPTIIGEQLVRLLSDKALRTERVQLGHQQAEYFTDERVACNLLSVYNELGNSIPS